MDYFDRENYFGQKMVEFYLKKFFFWKIRLSSGVHVQHPGLILFEIFLKKFDDVNIEKGKKSIDGQNLVGRLLVEILVYIGEKYFGQKMVSFYFFYFYSG